MDSGEQLKTLTSPELIGPNDRFGFKHLNIMDKKELKFYEAPACEVVELKASTALLAGSVKGGGSEDIPEDKIDDGFFD